MATRAQTMQIANDFTYRARPYEQDMLAAATRHRVDPLLLQVVAYLETRFSPAAISPRGARGMMQFMPATAARYRLRNPHHPPAAIDAAAQYLRDLSLRFHYRADLVLAAYNAGETAVDAYLHGYAIKIGSRIINPKGIITGGIPPYRETRNYVARGLILLSQLRANSSLVTISRVSLKIDSDITRPVNAAGVHRSIRAASDDEPDGIILKPKAKRRSIYFGNRQEEE